MQPIDQLMPFMNRKITLIKRINKNIGDVSAWRPSGWWCGAAWGLGATGRHFGGRREGNRHENKQALQSQILLMFNEVEWGGDWEDGGRWVHPMQKWAKTAGKLLLGDQEHVL